MNKLDNIITLANKELSTLDGLEKAALLHTAASYFENIVQSQATREIMRETFKKLTNI